MVNDDIMKAIAESVDKHLNEGWYDYSSNPYHSRAETFSQLGRNPLYVDNGNHASADAITQPSTVDWNGAAFRGKNYIISDTAFTIYQMKNFGNNRLTGTMSMFASIKEFRANIDRLNGGARRGGRPLTYRTFTSQSNASRARRNDFMSYTFWEFSLDGGNTWYILRPNPLEKMQPSKTVLSPNVKPDNVQNESKNNTNMGKTISMKKADFERFVSESVRKVLHEVGDTPEGQFMLGMLQAKKQRQQGAETGENNGYGHYNTGAAGEVGQYADQQQKNEPNPLRRNMMANAHADGFNAEWHRVGNQPLRLQRSR